MMNRPSEKRFCYFCGKQLGRNPWLLFPWRPNVIAGVKIGPADFEITGYACDECHETRFEEE